MLDTNIKTLNLEKQNLVFKKTLQLHNDLSCFIIVSSQNQKFAELLMNNILDHIIDKISSTNTYNDFSIALENINSCISEWNKDEDSLENQSDIVISLLQKNEFFFSNIGKTSVLLLNGFNEIVELTPKHEQKPLFSYISSGKLKDGELIISATLRLLDYLSHSDIVESATATADMKQFNKNIESILFGEIIPENIVIHSLEYSIEDELIGLKMNPVLEKLRTLKKHPTYKMCTAQYQKLAQKIGWNSKRFSNIIFLSGIAIAIFFLYSILSSVISMSSQSKQTDTAKQNMVQVKTYLRLASENIWNQDTFNLHINNAQKILDDIKTQKLFLNDVKKVSDDINILKKQFNKIELFETNQQNLVHQLEDQKGVKIIKNKLKTYIIWEKSISKPGVPQQGSKVYSFDQLDSSEKFIDGVFLWDNLYLLTNTSKIVQFSKSNNFKYMDVIGQKTWEAAKSIAQYGSNLYLLGTKENQIYKHKLSLWKFTQGSEYLKKEDVSQVGNMLDIAIDGWFYILKQDLSMVKFFNSPKYRLESLVINKLPKSYTIEEKYKDTISLQTRKELKYVYLLLNNKIWIFKPNTSDYRNTISLTYVGQIEWSGETIDDYYINYDGEILIMNTSWVYKVNFEVSDDRITLL